MVAFGFNDAVPHTSCDVVKVTNGWLKAIAKLPFLETLVLRGSSKVRGRGQGMVRGSFILFLLHLNTISIASIDASPC